MKNRFSNMRLFKQFAISFTITLFLPTFIISFISYYRATNQIQNMVRELSNQLTVNVSNQLDTIINDINYFSMQLANMSEVRQFVGYGKDDYAAVYVFKQKIEKDTLLEQLFKRYSIVNGMSIIGYNGITYSTGDNSTLEEGTYITGNGNNTPLDRKELFQGNIPDEGAMKIVVSKPVQTSGRPESDGGYIITFGRKVFPQYSYTPRGILTVDVHAENLNRLWERNDLKNGFIWIVDSKGQIMYYPDHSKIGLMAGDLINTSLMDNRNGSFSAILEQKKQFFVYYTSETTGWKIISTIPTKDINVPINDMRNTILYSFLVTFPLALLVGYLFVGSITKPIRKLEKGMKQLGNENWQLIEGPVPANEIGSLINGYNIMTRKISGLIEEVYKAEIQKKEVEFDKQKAEFQALQMQINPHFVYNTLSAVNTCAITGEETAIHEMVEALSKMLRYSVQNPLEPVRLKDELEHVEYYLTIQKYRCRIMPQIELRVAKYMDCRVLRLTLQPLIENIFQHAFPDGIKKDSKIVISAREEENFLILEISDNGAGLEWEDTEHVFDKENSNVHLGIGLMNVHRRIQIAYGEKYGLKIYGEREKGTRISMVLPYDI